MPALSGGSASVPTFSADLKPSGFQLALTTPSDAPFIASFPAGATSLTISAKVTFCASGVYNDSALRAGISASLTISNPVSRATLAPMSLPSFVSSPESGLHSDLTCFRMAGAMAGITEGFSFTDLRLSLEGLASAATTELWTYYLEEPSFVAFRYTLSDSPVQPKSFVRYPNSPLPCAHSLPPSLSFSLSLSRSPAFLCPCLLLFDDSSCHKLPYAEGPITPVQGDGGLQ